MPEAHTDSPLPQAGEGGHHILIAGAGPLGLCAGLRLASLGHNVQLFDARAADEAHQDQRVLALSHGSRQLLETLDAWPTQAATPIHNIHVSQRGALGRTEMRHADYGIPALGYVMQAGALMQALLARARAARLSIQYDARVTQFDADTTSIKLHLQSNSGQTRIAEGALALCCEGRIDADSADTTSRDYDQHALLLKALPEGGHANTAWERFTPDGPIALLPLGREFGVVWTMTAERLAALRALSDSELCAKLQTAFGSRVQFTSISGRASYPLGFRMRKSPVDERTVWLGNAAQTLHPVAGQGFNLGLRDVWELGEILRDAGHTQADPGSPALLARYASTRRADRLGATRFTDALVRLFSNDHPLITHARGAGLFALDVVPPLRHFVTKRMIFGARAWP